MDAETLINYDLAKKVPDMLGRGFTIETSYGEIVITPAEAEPFARLVEAMLMQRRKGFAE